MSIWSDANNWFFDDPNMASDAVYTAQGESPVTVRAIRTAPDVIESFTDYQISTDTLMLDVRVSEVAAPSSGDSITYEGEDRIVQGVPQRDDHRTIWTLDTRPA